jgi:hypothetical protein
MSRNGKFFLRTLGKKGDNKMAKRNDHEGTIWPLKNGGGFKGAIRLGNDFDGKPIRKYVQRKLKDDVRKEFNGC